MVVALLVHPVMQGVMRRGQHQAHPLVAACTQAQVLGVRADDVQVGQRPFDLLEDGQRIGGGQNKRELRPSLTVDMGTSLCIIKFQARFGFRLMASNRFTSASTSSLSTTSPSHLPS